jgi:hypothetical protein
MSENSTSYELSAEGLDKIQAVDAYLERAIRDGRPIEALIATRLLGEITGGRAKQAARAATEGAWTWTDVGRALGVTKQAAHERHRARIHDKIEREVSKLEGVEKARRAKITRAAQRGRKKLEHHAPPTSNVESARRRIDNWERRQHERLGRDMRKARETLVRAERTVDEKLDKEGLRR